MTPEQSHNPEITGNSRVIYAGTSPRRFEALKFILPNTLIEKIPGGEERDIEDVTSIALDKADEAEKTLQERFRESSNAQPVESFSQIFIISADARTKTPDATGDEHVYDWISKGKPQHACAVSQYFNDISQALRLKKPSCYSVDTATVLRTIKGPVRNETTSKHKLIVSLKHVSAHWLSTSEGFETYLRTFHDFYSSSEYHHMGPTMSPTDLSAGISLPVLIKLNAIEAINGVNQHDLLFEQTLKDAIYMVAVGINPSVLSKLNPYAKERIQDWPWLKQVTHHCLYE
jgi:hypothetical protein